MGSRFNVRDLVFIGLFGALWGALEIGLGSYLHVLKIPFTGTIMTGIGITVALVGRSFVPKRGSVMFVGLVTAMLKAFSLGGIVLNPMIGIIMESALAELGLIFSAKPRRWTFVLAGVLAVCWDFFHPFFTQGILAGSGIFTIYERTIQQGSRLLGIDESAVLVVLLCLVALRLVVGVATGVFAWTLTAAVRNRLGEAPSESTVEVHAD